MPPDALPADTKAPGTWHAVGTPDSIPAESGRAFSIAGQRIAVFRHLDGWFAIADRCPHERISLVSGRVHDGRITCPGHQWAFRLDTGETVVGPPKLRATTFAVREEAGQIAVLIPTPSPKS